MHYRHQGKAVAKIMQSWSRAPGLAGQSGGQATESTKHRVVPQASTVGVNKPMRDLPPVQKPFTPLPVIG